MPSNINSATPLNVNVGGATPLALTSTGATVTSINGGQLAGLRNRLINGDFQVWQRGTSFPAAASIVYTADRWAFYRSALSLGSTASQTSPSGIVGSSSFAIRVQRDSGNTSTDPINLAQCLETSIARRLAGQTVTLSFKQRTGVNISTGNIGVSIIWGTGTDQGVNSARAGSWAGQSTLISGGFTTGQSSFTTAALQFAIPSTALELMVVFAYTPTGTSGSNDYFDIADVQLEVGTVATPFEQRPFGMEFLLCQRYYETGWYRSDAYMLNTFRFGSAITYAARKRAVPTVNFSGTGYSNASSVAADAASTDTQVQITALATSTAQVAVATNWTASAEL